MPSRLKIGLLFCLAATVAMAAPRVERTTLEGALAAVARPEVPWNGGVLLLAHGFRPEGAPLLAELDLNDGFHRGLLAQGWIVGATSYRRNGIILAEAMEDLDRLRAWITARDGEPRRVIVEGHSMGGLIAVLLAEQDRSPYDGFIAIGAALELRDPSSSLGVNLRPQRPVLFMSNQTELEGPRRYAASILEIDREVVRPVVFRVSRDGHVNVNARERLYAFRALLAWLDRGRDALPVEARGESTEARVRPAISAGKVPAPTLTDREIHDATQPPEPRPSEVLIDGDTRGLLATVVGVAPIHGNVLVNAQAADFESIGLRPGAYFRLHAGERTYRVLYGREFSSVERGQWVLFPGADGFFWVARNHANAAETASLAIGDAVRLRRYDP